MAIDAALGRLGIRPGVCTSSTRPANPFEGQVIYETDTNNIRFWSGSAWESNKGGIISSSAPTGAAAGDIWYDSDDGRTYIYYDDGSSQQWVEFGAPPVQHGKILQVVSATKTDTFSTTSTSYVDLTGLAATITPTSSSSNIFVMFNVGISTSTANTIELVLDRSGTDICVSSTGATAMTFPDDQFDFEDVSNRFLDSPATTSAVTYQVQMKVATGTGYVNRRGANASFISTSTITVMEVSA